jgi:hypothetical protein
MRDPGLMQLLAGVGAMTLHQKHINRSNMHAG